MRKHYLSLAGGIVALCAVGAVGHAQSLVTLPWSKKEVKAIHVIQSNAIAARQNAHIYQWQRVNLEVDRIETAECTLQKAFKGDLALEQKSLALHKEVKALLSARLSRNIEQITEITRRLSSLLDLLPDQ